MSFHPIVPGGVASEQGIGDTYSVTGSNLGRTAGFHAVGTRGYDPETGRAWRYALIGDGTLGAAVIQGGLCVASLLSHANHDDITLTASGGAITAGLKSFALHEADVDTTDIVKDQYKYGYFHVQDSTGQGFSSRIVGHDAFDASETATDGRIVLEDEVPVALAATSQAALSRNPYDRIGPSTTSAEELVVGVANVAHAVSGALGTNVAGSSSDVSFVYGWVQTWGPCAVLQGGTPTQGLPVASGTAANEVEVVDLDATGTTVDNKTVIGVCMTGGTADADYALVDLRIAP